MIMKAKSHREVKRTHAKTILRLPDLDIAKAAVINSLSCPNAQRGYRHAIDEFVDWYCSEPRLSFSKTVVVRYRMHLESASRPWHDQPPIGRCAPSGVRSGRLRPPQRRFGGRNQAGQGRKETGCPVGQLVD